jgi:phosphoribosylanthranilate isomerase
MLRIIKIKICGITNLEDALTAVDMGADILGFNFYMKSPRYITIDKALKIIDKVPTFVDTAGIFVNPTADYIEEITEQGFLSWIQLHGDETPEFCDSLGHLSARIIKALRVASPEDIERAAQFPTDAILFDAYDPKSYGGTGKRFDWSTVPHLNRRVFLAGGINPENVAKALEIGVYGIDICSGIEKQPGKKDHEKMKLLFENIEMVRG